MARAEAGETLNIGFLGGSITQGCLASAPELCYAYRVFQWWEKTFPQAKFHYINAGIGGTTSHFGTARAESDLLSHKPDFVIIEFSVNDESTEFFRETYEGLVRRVWQDKNEPAVMLVHNVYYNNGGNAQIMHWSDSQTLSASGGQHAEQYLSGGRCGADSKPRDYRG